MPSEDRVGGDDKRDDFLRATKGNHLLPLQQQQHSLKKSQHTGHVSYVHTYQSNPSYFDTA